MLRGVWGKKRKINNHNGVGRKKDDDKSDRRSRKKKNASVEKDTTMDETRRPKVQLWEDSFAYEQEPSSPSDNRSVNDFETTEALRQALLSNTLSGSCHAVDPAQLFSDQAVLQELMSNKCAHKGDDAKTTEIDVKDMDQSLDWILENYDAQTTAEQSVDHELRRLLVLKSYLVLDTKRKISFEQITSRASKQFDCPIALISLVDLGRQWFLSSRGLGEVRETTRKLSFCAHAIMSKNDECLVVPDATQDFRFKDHPLVTGPPEIRFYAGAPLLSPEGHKLGTVCVVHHETKSFSTEEQEILKDLAAEAVDVLVDHRRMMSVWFNNLVKTKFPQFDMPELVDVSDDDESLHSRDDQDDMEMTQDHDVAVFLEITKRMSLKNLIFLLQSQARAQNLAPEYVQPQQVVELETRTETEPQPEPEPETKQKRVRFAKLETDDTTVRSEVHHVETVKHVKELWWSPEETQRIRQQAANAVQHYRSHQPQYTQSVEIVAKGTAPSECVEDHLRRLTEDRVARGFESHIVGLLSSRRQAVRSAVLEEQAECKQAGDDLETISYCLREQSLLHSQLSTRFAEAMGECDQVNALKATMSPWRRKPLLRRWGSAV